MNKIPIVYLKRSTIFTCVFGVSWACTIASTDVIAGYHHHAVGTVTVEVRKGAHRCRVITQDELRTVHSPGLVQLRPPRGHPLDLQSVSAYQRNRHTLWTTGHWNPQVKQR